MPPADSPPPPPPDRVDWRQRLLLQKLLVQTLRRRPRLIPLLAVALLAAQMVLPALRHGTEADPVLPAVAALGHLDRAIRAGQWWRLLTSWLLHQGTWHLVGNVVFLVVLGRPVEAVWGPARTWLICVAAGLAGSLLALNAHTPVMVGASGVALGLCGATLALGVRLWPRLTVPLRTLLVLAPLALLLLRLGSDAWLDASTHLNPYAHQGGALAGFAMGLWLQPQLPSELVGGRRLRPLFTRTAVTLTALALAVALGQGLAHLRRPIRLPLLTTREVAIAGQHLVIPAELQRGLLRSGRCVGDDIDVAWAFRTGRTLCFPLEPFGMLLLDRREHLLTLDSNDYAALQAADQLGRMVQSEPNVMLYPLGEEWLWLLQAPDGALRWHASALTSLLPPPGSAVVRRPPLSGRWLLPFELTLTVAAAPVLPAALDLGDGVQLRIGAASALLDPEGRDDLALALASGGQQFVRIQPGVMLFPLSAVLVAVLVGPDARLDGFAARLRAILPPSPPVVMPSLATWLTWPLQALWQAARQEK